MRAKLLTDFIEAPHPAHRRFRNLTGQTFGRLTVVSYAGGKGYSWNCLCQCGNKVSVTGGPLRGGVTRSCGCLHSEATLRIFTVHGESNSAADTPEYRAFTLAKERCHRVGGPAYANYGGRGIEFRFDSYEHFLTTLGRRPTPSHSLDRIDTDGHYEPGNVRWATWTQQQRNRRNNRMITIDGVTHCQSEWAEIYGISTKRINARRKRGWCDHCSVTTPLLPGRGGGCPHIS